MYVGDVPFLSYKALAQCEVFADGLKIQLEIQRPGTGYCGRGVVSPEYPSRIMSAVYRMIGCIRNQVHGTAPYTTDGYDVLLSMWLEPYGSIKFSVELLSL
jgi:hypothetical protein